jgi:phosphoenolpyruvate-protein phosphotransferase
LTPAEINHHSWSKMLMHKLKGIPASPGIALGPVYLFKDLQLEIIERADQDAQAELVRLEDALSSAKGQIEALRVEALQTVGEKEAAIFDAHGLFLEDPELLKSVRSAIESRSINCEFAWNTAIEGYAQQLEALEDEYFQARAADLRDVGRRVTRLLLGIEEVDLSGLDEPSIVVAKDLTPSDTVRLDKSMVKGFCTAEGGPTSHTAILAKALGLPAVVGVGLDLLSLENKTPLLIDGERGLVISNPDRETQEEMQLRLEASEAQAAIDLSTAKEPAITKDGHRVEVVANIGRPEESASSLEQGAEGIGLLRTEFLYLDKETAPDEEEQLEAYREILKVMDDRPVVVRTLDVGGDKPLPYLDLGEESNPFLGWRAIRMCLDEEDFFKIQLRALLRASPGHDLRIMFPMIATLDELTKAKRLLEEAREEVIAVGEGVSGEIQVGIMVEVPSVALMADQFAPHVDFFSIGTNDLTQYTMAAERTNEKVAYLGDALHPAILRQIRMVIDAAHARGIWVGLCGELAGDPQAIPILLGLGLDEFSMAPSMIPRAKSLIREWTVAASQELAARATDLESAEAVREFIAEFQVG